MAKKIDVNRLINTELQNLEDKVKEFQKYLQINSIISTVDGTRIDELSLTEEKQDKLHKEILVQIKMQDALFVWLPLLEKLREQRAEDELQTYGDAEINGMFKNRK